MAALTVLVAQKGHMRHFPVSEISVGGLRTCRGWGEGRNLYRMVGYGGGLGLLPLNVGMASVRYAAAYRGRKDSGGGDEEVGRGRKRREYTEDTSEEGFLLPPRDGDLLVVVVVVVSHGAPVSGPPSPPSLTTKRLSNRAPMVGVVR